MSRVSRWVPSRCASSPAWPEKDLTTPGRCHAPLTLNALTNACNQSSNREPVVAYDERDVVRGLDLLRERKLAFEFQGADSRVAKYGHRLGESLGLELPQVAVLCVLMLPGPQTVGEIRGRTGRMHEFATLAEAESVLDGLAARTPDPLVAKLARQSGRKEQRYAQLLSGAPGPQEPAAAQEPAAESDSRLDALESGAAALRAEVAELRRQFAEFKKQLE